MKDDFPVYIKWRYICSYMLDISGKFPKNVRFNLADRLTNISLDVLEAIIEAIYAKDKTEILKKANLQIEKIRALLQISNDRKYISISQYGHISGEINEAGKMIGGWIKTIKN
ncbi:MAG TPA: diversity-generating retroelement protein Avd [Spirochaetota bacterium]|nr:diversity-generating retroelement protein Avd [Spirochaetota bacterium]HOH36916.1 diversity-generating retroelement protein Avd [Spirochaetota bacterium]HPA64795.1 diversity-generating retroelement protein Avd [Spirochaetota bacterium]HPY02960.1 diversity-generating retroelement protein Avd [Spirochaetota bacterium]HQA52345.1 diversity-generating retroelement protein Avd [Spirochaetota bacterium]